MHYLCIKAHRWLPARCAVDAVFYSWALRSYARTHKYTGIIIAYVFGAGAMTVSLSPNFGRLFKRQAANEGAQPALPARWPPAASPATLAICCWPPSRNASCGGQLCQYVPTQLPDGSYEITKRPKAGSTCAAFVPHSSS